MDEETGQAERNGVDQPEAAAAAPGPSLKDLAEIRSRHHARYKEREDAAARQEQEIRDAELAAELAKEEEEARRRQLEADEEYSRQLAAQLNPGGSSPVGPGVDHPMQDLARGGPDMMDYVDNDLGHYHQLEDGEDGYRAPMRTGYVDRLIEPPQAFRVPFAPLLADPSGAGARQMERRGGVCQRCRPLLIMLAPSLLIGAVLAYLTYIQLGSR